MEGKGQEIDIQGADIDGLMRHRLGAIQQHPGAVPVGDGDDLFGWQGHTSDVGGIGHAHQAHPVFLEMGFKGCEIENFPIIDPRVIDLDQARFLQPQPGKQVRVMFPVGQQDYISRLKLKTQGDRIDGMGCV